MKIVYKNCPKDIKKLVDGSVGSNESEYRMFIAGQPEEILVKTLDYLKQNGVNITRQRVIEKELKAKRKAGLAQKTNHDFVMSTGRHFSEEWTDIRKAAGKEKK